MTLSSPQAVQARLEGIEVDLAARQNTFEAAAFAWFKVKRDKEREWATAYLAASGPVHERKAHADLAVATIGALEEAEYEAVKAVVRTLEARATIGQSILRSQGRF